MAAVTVYANTAKDRPARSGTGLQGVPFSYTPAAPFGATIGDVIVLCKLPAYSTLLGFWIEIPDLDSGATAARFDIGTKSSAARFVADFNPTGATTVRVTSFDSTATANTHVLLESLPFQVLDTDAGDVTAEDDLRLTLKTAAITTLITSKAIKGFALFCCNEVAAMAEVKL